MVYDIEFDEEFDEPEEGTTTTSTNSLGIEITEIYEDGDWHILGYTEPWWEYVCDEDDSRVCCPYCGNELRFNGNDICCIECDERFSEQQIVEEAGSEIHFE